MKLLILPGWHDSDAQHWQSRWAQLHQDAYHFERLEQHDWEQPLRGDWMVRLQEQVAASSEPLTLVAHSLGCHLVAAWSAHSALHERVRAALLVAPPDTQAPSWPAQLHTWRDSVQQPLPFKSLVLASSDDPFCSLEAAGALAQSWGSALMVLGALGHINTASGLGAWDQGWQLLTQLLHEKKSWQ